MRHSMQMTNANLVTRTAKGKKRWSAKREPWLQSATSHWAMQERLSMPRWSFNRTCFRHCIHVALIFGSVVFPWRSADALWSILGWPKWAHFVHTHLLWGRWRAKHLCWANGHTAVALQFFLNTNRRSGHIQYLIYILYCICNSRWMMTTSKCMPSFARVITRG